MTSVGAQELPSRLRYTLPPDWTPTVDGKSVLPPGGRAIVTFGPSTLFSGTRERWLESVWSDLGNQLRLLSDAAPREHGQFLARVGLFRHPDGHEVWIALNALVHDGRGESVILIAEGDAAFHASLPAFQQLLASTTVPIAATESTSHAPNAPTTSDTSNADSGIAGLYLASTAQYRFNPLGSSGSAAMEWRTEFYLLDADGRVFRGPDLPQAPQGDISRFDFDAARRQAPDAYGTWRMRGRDVVLTIGQTTPETIIATQPSPGVLQIRGTNYKRSIAGERPDR